MSDYLHIKDWRKFRRGEIVRVVTKLYPEIDGIYQLRHVHVSSNFPYRIWYDNQEQLLRKNEVYKVSRPTELHHD